MDTAFVNGRFLSYDEDFELSSTFSLSGFECDLDFNTTEELQPFDTNYSQSNGSFECAINENVDEFFSNTHQNMQLSPDTAKEQRSFSDSAMNSSCGMFLYDSGFRMDSPQSLQCNEFSIKQNDIFGEAVPDPTPSMQLSLHELNNESSCSNSSEFLNFEEVMFLLSSPKNSLQQVESRNKVDDLNVNFGISISSPSSLMQMSPINEKEQRSFSASNMNLFDGFFINESCTSTGACSNQNNLNMNDDREIENHRKVSKIDQMKSSISIEKLFAFFMKLNEYPHSSGETGIRPRFLKKEDIEIHFSKPLEVAAFDLGISTTMLKSSCRRVGIYKWPQRKIGFIEKLEKKLNDGKALLSDNTVMDGKDALLIEVNDRIRKLGLLKKRIMYATSNGIEIKSNEKSLKSKDFHSFFLISKDGEISGLCFSTTNEKKKSEELMSRLYSFLTEAKRSTYSISNRSGIFANESNQRGSSSQRGHLERLMEGFEAPTLEERLQRIQDHSMRLQNQRRASSTSSTF